MSDKDLGADPAFVASPSSREGVSTEGFNRGESVWLISDDIIRDVLAHAIPRSLPADSDKSEEDWAEHYEQGRWRERAFNRFHPIAGPYLTATLGGQQTSRDMHMLCQGFALAMEALPYRLRDTTRPTGEEPSPKVERGLERKLLDALERLLSYALSEDFQGDLQKGSCLRDDCEDAIATARAALATGDAVNDGGV